MHATWTIHELEIESNSGSPHRRGFGQGRTRVAATLAERSKQISVGRVCNRNRRHAGLTAVTVAPKQTSSQNLQRSSAFFADPISLLRRDLCCSLACGWRHAYLLPPLWERSGLVIAECRTAGPATYIPPLPFIPVKLFVGVYVVWRRECILQFCCCLPIYYPSTN